MGLQTAPNLAAGGGARSRGLALIPVHGKRPAYDFLKGVLVPKPDAEYTVGGIGILSFAS